MTVTIAEVKPQAFDADDLKRACLVQMTDEQRLCIGAWVEFTGFVRADKLSQDAQDAQDAQDTQDTEQVTAICLEHYPAMTDKALADIFDQAKQRFSCDAMVLVHRVGELSVGESIVYVAVMSSHRKDAFACAQFLMDYLKNDVPIWKKEIFADDARWVDQKLSDKSAKSLWQ